MNSVISQPMYLPWCGLFEQIRLCDVFVYYNDVQFSKGSFTNRVQIKANNREGIEWLTIPLTNLKLGININQLLINQKIDWKNGHRLLLEQNYYGAPFYSEMKKLVEELLAYETESLSEFAIKSMEIILRYFELDKNKSFFKSSDLNISGKSSQRVLDIVTHFKCNKYVTGHGASKYLDHYLFEKKGIEVEYIDYRKNVYPQMNGPFTPYVSIIDLIANTGKNGIDYINSSTVNWKKFITVNS